MEEQSFIWKKVEIHFLKCEIIFPSYIYYKSQMGPEVAIGTS